MAAGETADEVEIAIEKVVIGKARRRLPFDGFKDVVDRLGRERGDAEEDQQDGRAVRIGKLVARQFLAGRGFDAELFAELAH